jgi:hypothetical protein
MPVENENLLWLCQGDFLYSITGYRISNNEYDHGNYTQYFELGISKKR